MESNGTHVHCGYRYQSKLLADEGGDGGPPVFFLSGAFQTMASWRKMANHFRKQRRVLLADLPGTGSADVLPSSENLELLADCILKVLDHYRVPEAVLISASYGTPIAYQCAQKFGNRLSGLVLAAR